MSGPETGSLRDVVSLAEAQARVRKERVGMRDSILRKPESFKVVVSEDKGNKTGYSLDLAGQLVPFTTDGINSLCRLLKMDFKYFSQFPRKQEFVEHVQTLLPKVMTENDGALVRQFADGSVRGICPGNYTIMDDEQVLGLIGAIAGQTLRQLKGVQVRSSAGNGSLYRLVFGDSALNSTDEIYPNVTVRNSEVGGSLSLQFGTLRIRCLNGSIDTSKVGSILNWGHRGTFDKQVMKVGDALRMGAERTGRMVTALKESYKKELSHPGEDLHRLLRAGWITPAFHDNAEGVLAAQLTSGTTFGGKSPKTKYAVFNALTEAAKVYRTKEQARYEAVAHNYLMLK